jgi:hypothetical protein
VGGTGEVVEVAKDEDGTMRGSNYAYSYIRI